MVNIIDGIPGSRPNVSGTNSKPRPESSETGARLAPSAGSDEVSLTSSPQLLRELNDAVDVAPGSNESRVNAIRQALSEGYYDIDAGNIADKLLRLDQQL